MNKEQRKFKKSINKRKKIIAKKAKKIGALNAFKKMFLRWKLVDILKRRIYGPPKKHERKDELMEEASKIKPLTVMEVQYSTDIDKLREKSKPVTKIDKDFIERLGSTLIRSNGIAIAAIQVGVPEQYVIIRGEGEAYVLINPVIKKEYWQKTWEREGCLSLPNEKPVLVPRPSKITIDFMDEKGMKYADVEFGGKLARIIKHEIDHLNGVIIQDYNEQK